MSNAYVGKVTQIYARNDNQRAPWLTLEDYYGTGGKGLAIGIEPFDSNNLFIMMNAAAISGSYVLVFTRKVEPSTIFNIDRAIVEAFLIPPSTNKNEMELQINTLKEKYLSQEMDAVKLT